MWAAACGAVCIRREQRNERDYCTVSGATLDHSPAIVQEDRFWSSVIGIVFSVEDYSEWAQSQASPPIQY